MVFRHAATSGRDVRANEYAGRLGAKLFAVAGVLTLVNNNIPPYDHLNRPVLYGVGVSALLWGLGSRLAPWGRWPRWATVVLAPVALAHIAVANLYGGVSAYSYAVYFVVVFVYVGMSQPPRSSLLLAAPAFLAYVLPGLVSPQLPAIAALSAFVTIPVCVLVGEVISRAIDRHRAAQAESERRADLLATVGRTSRRVNALEVDEVLHMVVEAAIELGFDAAELCVLDEADGVHRTVVHRGLPAHYRGEPQAIESGMAGRVRAAGRTVVIDDYSGTAVAVPSLRGAGYRATAGVPIEVDNDLVAVLVAGVRHREPLAPEDVEAAELLAVQAGRALENAHRFDAERRMVRRLAELERLKGDFISNISHELRTPLTVIEGMGTTLADRWERLSPGVRDDLLERLNRNARVLDEIISTLLDFSRLEAGRLEADIQPVDLAALCESVTGRIRSLFAQHELVLELPPRAEAMADPVLIERVLENLLSNAAHHTPPGTRVDLSLRLLPGRAEVAVTDSGPGIRPEDLRELGHRFFRGGDPDTRTRRGTGLGLAFCRELLRLHGSVLEITSRVGHGSRFAFSLPSSEPELEIASDQAGSSTKTRISRPARSA